MQLVMCHDKPMTAKVIADISYIYAECLVYTVNCWHHNCINALHVLLSKMSGLMFLVMTHTNLITEHNYTSSRYCGKFLQLLLYS